VATGVGGLDDEDVGGAGLGGGDGGGDRADLDPDFGEVGGGFADGDGPVGEIGGGVRCKEPDCCGWEGELREGFCYVGEVESPEYEADSYGKDVGRGVGDWIAS
jgi:hypothetical protein